MLSRLTSQERVVVFLVAALLVTGYFVKMLRETGESMDENRVNPTAMPVEEGKI